MSLTGSFEVKSKITSHFKITSLPNKRLFQSLFFKETKIFLYLFKTWCESKTMETHCYVYNLSKVISILGFLPLTTHNDDHNIDCPKNILTHVQCSLNNFHIVIKFFVLVVSRYYNASQDHYAPYRMNENLEKTIKSSKICESSRLSRSKAQEINIHRCSTKNLTN